VPREAQQLLHHGVMGSGQYTTRLSAQKSTMSPSRKMVRHSYCLRKESRRSAWQAREPR